MLEKLKAKIDAGLNDLVAGRTKIFDKARIVERGKKLLAERTQGKATLMYNLFVSARRRRGMASLGRSIPRRVRLASIACRIAFRDSPPRFGPLS